MLSGFLFEPSTSQRWRRNNSPFTTTFSPDCTEAILCVGVSVGTCLCICARVHIFKVIFSIWILVSDTTYDLTAAKRVQFLVIGCIMSHKEVIELLLLFWIFVSQLRIKEVTQKTAFMLNWNVFLRIALSTLCACKSHCLKSAKSEVA